MFKGSPIITCLTIGDHMFKGSHHILQAPFLSGAIHEGEDFFFLIRYERFIEREKLTL
jgi:hypothetical protein